MTINVNEFGDVIYVNMGQDVSAATSHKVILQPPRGEVLEKTGTLGTADVTFEGVNYLANRYITYTTAKGDIGKSGLWRKKGKSVMSATREILTNYSRFAVLD